MIAVVATIFAIFILAVVVIAAEPAFFAWLDRQEHREHDPF